MLPPPTLRLLPATASTTWSNVRSYLISGSGSMRTWYCFSKPPQELISAVPGTVRRAGLTTQSCMRAQLGQVVAVSLMTQVVKDLAQAGGDRAHLRPLDARRASRPSPSRSLISCRAK